MVESTPPITEETPEKHIEPKAGKAERIEVREIAPEAGAEPVSCACTWFTGRRQIMNATKRRL